MAANTGTDFAPDPPTNFRATGYDSHVELRWQPSAGVAQYRIYRSADDGQTFEPVATLFRTDTLYLDWVRPLGTELDLQYRISALDGTGSESELTDPVSLEVRPASDEALLTMVQEYTFRYFWDYAHPVSGLIRERSNGNDDVVTMGGTGFGVMAILSGIERDFITREQGLDRLLKMVLFLETADRFYGAYPHWMSGTTGDVFPFSPLDDGGDIVETAFLFEGLLCARQYFDGNSTDEVVLRQKITQLYQQVNWNWYRKENQDVIYWHWSPDNEFAINLPVRGWNETMMVYLLAIASPTKGVPASLWDTGWAGGDYLNGNAYYGIELPLGRFTGGPLFFTHYSFLGFDPRGIRDDYANYFVQNRNQTLINRAYCIDNPEDFEGYSEESWGLTASDDPLTGYFAHAPMPDRDNGTLTPTAALSSMPYTPEESMAVLKHLYRDLGKDLWGPMGFYDAFNPTLDWVAPSYLAIDQGPIVGMIENYRSGLLWNLFMSNSEIQTALNAIGFEEDTLTTSLRPFSADQGLEMRVFPNPVSLTAQIELQSSASRMIDLDLINASGQALETIFSETEFPAGKTILPLPVRDLPAGLYFLRLRHEREVLVKRLIISP